MADYWKLKIKKYKDSTGNWQTTLTGGYVTIEGKVDPMIQYKEPDYIKDGNGNPTSEKANSGYWKVNAELTNLINPFTNPITNQELGITKIQVAYEGMVWDKMSSYQNYSQYLATGAAQKIQKRYKELFGVEIELSTIFQKGEDEAKPATTTASQSTTSASQSTTKTVSETVAGTASGQTASEAGATASETGLYGEFTFNVEEEFLFKGNLEFGTLEIIGKGIIKEEEETIPEETIPGEEIDEEYLETDFQGLEEKDMVFEVAEFVGVGAEELEYSTPPADGSTGSKNGSGMSAKEWEKNGTLVIGSKVPSDLSGPANYTQKVTLNKTMKNEYLPKIKKMTGYTNGIKLLAIVMAQKEGFAAGTRSYRTNNPGNIGNTDSGSNKTLKKLEDGIKLQLDYIKKVADGSHTAYPLNKEKYMKPYYSPEIAKNNGPNGPYKGMTEYLPGYKFTYTGMIEQYVKIYATGARTGNSYISMIVSWYRQNGYSWVTGETTIAQLIEQNKKDVGIFEDKPA